MKSQTMWGVFALLRRWESACARALLRHRNSLTSIVLVVACLGACAPAVRVVTASDPGANVSKFRTFAMLEPNRPVHSDNPKVDPFVLQRLRQLVFLALKQKGYRPVERGESDLIVAVIAGQDEHVEVYSDGSYGDYPMMGPPRPHYVYRSEYRIVVIDIIERDKMSVVWRGTGERAMDGKLADAELSEMVDAILNQFQNAAAGE
jgi:hypothetical protein